MRVSCICEVLKISLHKNFTSIIHILHISGAMLAPSLMPSRWCKAFQAKFGKERASRC